MSQANDNGESAEILRLDDGSNALQHFRKNVAIGSILQNNGVEIKDGDRFEEKKPEHKNMSLLSNKSSPEIREDKKTDSEDEKGLCSASLGKRKRYANDMPQQKEMTHGPESLYTPQPNVNRSITTEGDSLPAEFILRPPVKEEEVNAVCIKMEEILDDSRRRIDSEGYEAFRRWAAGDLDEDREEDDGKNSEEKADAERKKAEQSLRDAVVQGSPRMYQTTLFEIAKTKNTIVNLGTGQGKTLIALLLIRHFSSPAFKEGKQSWFIVPSVALAVQHKTTLLANLPFSVAIACHHTSNSEKARKELSESNVVVATHGSAMDLLNHYGDIFNFSRINLLVVDECHYASGNHRYTHIMQRHYHALPKDQRPRVLGLTASLFVNVRKSVDDEKLEKMLRELESTLDCTLATFTSLNNLEEENVASPKTESERRGSSDFIAKKISSAEERVIHYHSSHPSNPLPSLHDLNLHESRVGEFKQLQRVYIDLGPKVTAVYSSTLFREVSRNKWLNETHEEFEAVKTHLLGISEFCLRKCENCPDGGRTEKLAVLEELLEDLVEGGSKSSGGKADKDPVGVVFVDMRITALALYDYFRARKRGLEEGTWQRVGQSTWSRRKKPNECHKTEDNRRSGIDDPIDQAIRDAVMTGMPEGLGLNHLGFLSDSCVDAIDADTSMEYPSDNTTESKAKSSLRCEVLVRHSTQVFKYLDKSQQPLSSKFSPHLRNNNKERGRDGGGGEQWLHHQKKIRDVLDGMRRGETNVLIATSVVEEGVDVAACSFVIVFDNLRSSKAYVQMKGRARRKDAKLYVFQNSHPSAQNPGVMTLKTAQEVERRVKQFIQARETRVPQYFPPNMLLGRGYIGPSLCIEGKALKDGEYRAKNGVVDLSSAKGLLNRYALSIPVDPSSRHSRDAMLLQMPSYDGDGILTLPSHLPSDVRCVELPEQYRDHGGQTVAGRRDRQSLLALMACVRLHSLHLLSDRLLPLRRKDMHEKLLTVALTRLPSFGAPLPQATPPNHGAGEDNKLVYVYPLKQSGPVFKQHDEALNGNGRVLCLISLAALPDTIPGLRFRHHELNNVSVNVGRLKKEQLSAVQWILCTEFYEIVINGRFRKRSKNHWYRYSADKARKGVLTPHIVGCLTKGGELDWKRMRCTVENFGRSQGERINAAASLVVTETGDFIAPRLVSPQYDPNIKYIAYGLSGLSCDSDFPSQNIEGIRTYADYFQKKREFPVDPTCKLLAVQRFWHLPRRVLRDKAIAVLNKKAKEEEPEKLELQEGERAPCKGLVSCLLPQEAIMESHLPDASLFLHCVHLPHILFHTDRVLQVRAFNNYCLKHLPILGKYLAKIDTEDLMEAISAKSCTLETNYDKLEWLGDAVLKLLHTDTLLHSRELRKWVAILHEGDLSTLRSAMGSNARLKDASQSSGIYRYVLIFSLGRGQWVPSCLEMYEVRDDKKEVDAPIESTKPSDKVCADIMESLLGLIYIHFGFQTAVDVAVELGISLPRDPDIETKPTDTPKGNMLELSKKYLGKTDFIRPELLEEALTHPSAIHEEVPNYQRLEWVGDAVLCLAAREHVYRQYSFLGLAEMNVVESTFVCNETLAYLCVSKGLSRFINHRDPCLPSRLAEFEHSLRSSGRGLWGTDPPKVLGDVVESMIGAAHVDGGFNEGQAAALFVLKPIIDTISPTLNDCQSDPNERARKMLMHPKQELHEMAGGILQIKAWKEEDFAGLKLNCPVWCGDSWGRANEQGNGTVGVVHSLGINLTAALEPNSQVARNRACALVVSAFHQVPALMDKLKAIFRTIVPRKEVEDDEASEI